MDEFEINIIFKSDKQSIRNIKVFANFDYYLRKLLKIEMIGLLYLDIDTPMGASRIVSSGTLDLVQDEPILIDSVKRTLYNIDPLEEQKGLNGYTDFGSIMEYYMFRNERT